MGPASILVVEDDESVAYVAVTALRLADFEVVGAPTGRGALELAKGEPPPDLLVLDVLLPDVDGFEVCRRLRADGVEMPIVFLTAKGTTSDRVRGLTMGGDDYLTKPFSAEELVARVRAILRRSGRVADARLLTCADLILDEDAHRVVRNGQVVALSPTEYKLLRLLLRNTGRVLSRAQILDHVWDYDFRGESTVVETFVSQLRRKLENDGPPLIHTVRGVGYRLSPQ